MIGVGDFVKIKASVSDELDNLYHICRYTVEEIKYDNYNEKVIRIKYKWYRAAHFELDNRKIMIEVNLDYPCILFSTRKN